MESALLYIPILKWRQGEYQALSRLTPEVANKILPLVEIPPIEWDFELGKLAKTLDDHLKRFSHRVIAKWGQRPILVDLHLLGSSDIMADGRHAATYIFTELRKEGATAVPVSGIGRKPNYQQAVADIIAHDQRGVCLRVSLEDLSNADIEQRLNALMMQFEVQPSDVSLVIDLGAPAFEPISVFCNAIRAAISQISLRENARTFCISGTAFPESMSSLQNGLQRIPRSEWTLFKQYIASASLDERLPIFGDYGIAHPSLPSGDMRILKPSATIRYTTDKSWIVVKGANVRDNGFGQYLGLCKSLVADKDFMGTTYSAGDKYIRECSSGKTSFGNLSTWRWIGTNHHVTRVVNDLATLFGSLDSLSQFS
jgi:hypothetical protein